MSELLWKRAEELRAANKVKESVRGSGYHDDDRLPARPDLYAAPQRNGLPRISEHLVPFFDFDGEEVHFVGPDADKALAALRDWEERPKGDIANLPGTERKLLLKIIPNLVVIKVEGLPRLMIRLSEWNDVLHALYQQGVGLSGLPLVE